MGMGEKSIGKPVDERYRKVLNRNDPFDQLIFNLASTGILNVAVVDIGVTGKELRPRQYSRKSLHRQGKHSS